MSFGYIYLVWEREFVNKKEDVYKIGMTQNIMKRMSQYPKGSKMLFSIFTDNIQSTENDLKRRFCDDFKARSDIGREYFQGNINEMIKTITDYVISRSTNLMFVYDEQDVKTQPKKKDDSIVIMEFVDQYRVEFSEKTLKSKDVYDKMINWIDEKDYSNYMSHVKMTRELASSYDVKSKVHRFQ